MDQLNFLIDKETHEKLKQLAKNSERSKAQFLRWIVQQEWEARNPSPAVIENQNTPQAESA